MIYALILLSTIAIGWGVYELVDDDDSDNADEGEEFEGGEDGDVLEGTDLADLIFGEDGNDTIEGEDGDDELFGQAGNDVIDGGDDSDLLEGGLGQDSLTGGDGLDFLGGGEGDDVLSGEDGNDILFGNAGDDELDGGDEDDVLVGADGNDVLRGGEGDDSLVGGFDSSVTNSGGDLGRDLPAEFAEGLFELAETNPDLFLNGTLGEILEDPIFAGLDLPFDEPEVSETGSDTLFGEGGDDILQLGAGDFGNGGEGEDTFAVSTNLSGEAATIEDFESGVDQIEITFDITDGPPTIEFDEDGDDTIVRVEDTEILRVLGTAGQLSQADINLVAFPG